MYTNCKQYRLVVIGFLIAALATRVFADTATERYSLAKGYYSQHRWREAAREFRQLLEKHPQFDQANFARFLLGESLVQTGDYAEAHRSSQANSQFSKRRALATGR